MSDMAIGAEKVASAVLAGQLQQLDLDYAALLIEKTEVEQLLTASTSMTDDGFEALTVRHRAVLGKLHTADMVIEQRKKNLLATKVAELSSEFEAAFHELDSEAYPAATALNGKIGDFIRGLESLRGKLTPAEEKLAGQLHGYYSGLDLALSLSEVKKAKADFDRVRATYESIRTDLLAYEAEHEAFQKARLEEWYRVALLQGRMVDLKHALADLGAPVPPVVDQKKYAFLARYL